MAVLVEGISVIIKKNSLANCLSTRIDDFVKSVPNQTLCMDDDLIRVGFMSPHDVEDYIGHLETFGLVYLDNQRPFDIAVADQMTGLAVACDWLDFRRVEIQKGQFVSACSLVGAAYGGPVAVPDGWVYERSLSCKYQRFEPEDAAKNLELVRRESGVTTFRDKETGKILYSGSPTASAAHEEFEAIQAIATRTLELDQLADKARSANDEKLGASVYGELMELSSSAEKLCLRAKFCCGFAHFAHGLVRRVLKRPQDAEVQFRKSLSYSPNVINTLLELTRCLSEQNRPADAEEFARRAVEVEPSSAAAWGNLAMNLIELRRREEARKAIDKAISLDPQDKINRYILEHFDGYFDKR
jgi:hypothetical protein